MSLLSDREMTSESNSLREKKRPRVMSLNKKNEPLNESSIKQSVSNALTLTLKRKRNKCSFTSEEDDEEDYELNELCTHNQINKFNSNMRNPIRKSSLRTELENSSSVNTKNINNKVKMHKRQHLMKRTSSKIASTNQTYLVEKNKQVNTMCMKRQEGFSHLSMSSIENNLNVEDSMRHHIMQQFTIQTEMCTSCIQKINYTPCELCAQDSVQNQNSQASYESWLNDTNILSSTPLQSVDQTKPSVRLANPFNLLRNCIFTSSRKQTRKEKTTQHKKEFKLEAYVSERGEMIKQLKVRKSFKKNQIEVNAVRRAKKLSSTRKYNLPRTSSFNSNSDDMDFDEFQHLNANAHLQQQQENLLVESMMPVAKAGQNFNNYGDFVVWYV